MKNTATLATLAAGLSQVAATGFGGWGSAPAFNCPANTDNKCTEKQVPGFDWKDLPTGAFDSYGGFNWKGFTCENKFSKRDELVPRTFGFQDKCISGIAHHDKKKAPSFGCNGKDIEKTSIGGFQVTPEFDCDLEFHYGMPDGSTCKHRTFCKKSGTFVKNTQCGGAKDVTVIVPKQPAVPKETCNFGFHSITFDCNTKSSTVPPKPSSTHYQASSHSSAATTSSAASVKTTVSSSASVVVSTSAASSSASTGKGPSSSPAVTSSSAKPTTSSVGVPSYSASKPVESASKPVESASKPVESASKPVESASKPVESATQSASKSVATESASTHVTTYMTTSTMYTTSVHTVTSCGPEVTNCPASSTATTIVTVPVGTTICPVTETHVASSSKPVETAPGKPTESSPGKPTESAPGKPVESVPGKPTGASSTVAVPATSSKPATPAGPVETLPCPAVVPSCLNTWMFSVGCKDNTDAACYCPDSKFTKAIYECMAAHGDSQETIADAIEYFKGICAPFIPTNPGIATGADHLTYITAKPTPVPSATYTTILVTATTVVPVTDDAGAEITSSSSTVTISTTMTVPQIAITTGEAGAAEPSVGVVPGTYVAQPAPTATVPAGPTGNNGGAAPYPTTMVPAKPTGTGAVYPTAAPSQTAPVTAGAGRVGSGMAFAAIVAAVAAAL
ncbi:adhesin protein mad1 protein [Apiospora rasikravindrae]|uniref:Adhesin protein mad1 protein n=1 Tax=Apiospora rasikravindrae TaxID=990691 RepID=A0ABR1T6E0_9PEZI